MAKATGAAGEARIVDKDEIEADVTQIKRTPDGSSQTVKFKANVKVDDSVQDTGESDDSESADDSEYPVFEAQAIPKTALESMFEKLYYAIETQGLNDGFYASVQRLPDPIGNMRFNVPCSMLSDLGWFQFTTRDKFNFIRALQELNSNSGGLFNITVCDFYTGKPIEILNYRDFKIPVGMANYLVPNPTIQPETITANSNTVAPSSFEALMLKQMERSDERFNALMSQMNKPREKSALEAAIEQKVLNDILNPPERKDSSNMDDIFKTFFMFPKVMEKMSDRMFPDAPAPAEPDWLDRVERIASIPPVQNTLNGLVKMSEEFAISKMQAQNGAMPQTANPNDYYEDGEVDEMQLLVTDLIAEVNSDRPLDATNEALIKLNAEFPEQAKIIRTTCRTLDFNSTLSMLVNMTAEMQPFPFAAFLDIPATQAQSQLVWLDPDGVRIKERLEEFYNFARTS